MSRIYSSVLILAAAVTLSACGASMIDGDARGDVMLITHTERGTLYWE